MTASNLHNEAKQAEPSHRPLLLRLPTPIAIAILILSVTAPFVWSAMTHWNPLVGIIGAPVAVAAYGKMRFGGRSFGPLWLELVDVIVLVGNVIAFILSSVAAIRIWF